jgi:hypothetical protein
MKAPNPSKVFRTHEHVSFTTSNYQTTLGKLEMTQSEMRSVHFDLSELEPSTRCPHTPSIKSTALAYMVMKNTVEPYLNYASPMEGM